MINNNLTNPLLETVSLVKHKALTSDKTKRINKRSFSLRTGLHQDYLKLNCKAQAQQKYSKAYELCAQVKPSSKSIDGLSK